MADVLSLTGRRCGRVAVLCAASLTASPASSHGLVETLAPEQITEGVSALGLPPPEDWLSIRDWRPLSVRLDCGLETKTPAACAAADITRAPLLESAAETAMRWLRNEGLPSPSRLGPVLDPEIGGGRLLIFSRALEGAKAMETPCRARQGGFRGVTISYGLPVAIDETGDAIDRLKTADGENLLTIGGVMAHELAHAIQDSVQADSAGWERACDPGGYYGRIKMLYEGLADFVEERFIRANRMPGQPIISDYLVSALNVSSEGTTVSQLRSLYGAGRFSLGLFDETNRYYASSFFRHLAERYHDGSARLHNLFFDPDGFPIGTGTGPSDPAEWLSRMMEVFLLTQPFGPALTQAYADIASLPDTRFEDRLRLPSDVPRRRWRASTFGCHRSQVTPAAGNDGTVQGLVSLSPALTSVSADVQLPPYSGHCIEVYLSPESWQEGHAVLHVKLTAPDAQTADGLHLGLAQIIEGKPARITPRRVSHPVAGREDPLIVESARVVEPEEVVFSCAEALDRWAEGDGEAARRCVLLRDGPIKEAEGYAVRWSLPMPLVPNGRTATLILTYAPGIDKQGFVGVPQERFFEQDPVGVVVELGLEATTEQGSVVDAAPVTAPEAVCAGDGETLRVLTLRPVTRSFGVADWAPFDFPDDIRSDIGSDLSLERVGSFAPSLDDRDRSYYSALTAALQMDVPETWAAITGAASAAEGLRDAFNKVREDDGTLFGFTLKAARYPVCDGVTDDDALAPTAGDDLQISARIARFDGDDFLGYFVERLSALQPGKTLELQGLVFDRSRGGREARGRLTVLGREGTGLAVALEFDLGEGETLRFSGHLPFLDHWTFSAARTPLDTGLQRYYLARWKREEMREYLGRPADDLGRALSPDDPDREMDPAAGGIASADVGSGGTQGTLPTDCDCSCDGYDALKGWSLSPSRRMTCLRDCCQEYAMCRPGGSDSESSLATSCD